ncbi:uncharacterized protein LOC113345889 [Papaver somniferum]|uniref:uncharacterized protein LOC113345889 n=1 Tax=Papaver somniferum TaxID=3469 RepID=UPI000E6F4799|nr:uncharacterized protein LOC113345889 [Papaver somniferum]
MDLCITILSLIKIPRKTENDREAVMSITTRTVFTGFGIGCGVGIGLGPCSSLGAIPVVQQVMSAMAATIGATNALSGAGLRIFGVKKAGVGCGIVFGHGYGAGIAPSAALVHNLQPCAAQIMAKMMMKIRTVPGLSMGQSMLPPSQQSSISVMTMTPMQNPVGNNISLTLKTREHTGQLQAKDGSLDAGSVFKHNAPKGKPSAITFGRKNLYHLQYAAFRDGEDSETLENIVLQTVWALKLFQLTLIFQHPVVKHQKVTDEQMEEIKKASSDSSS